MGCGGKRAGGMLEDLLEKAGGCAVIDGGFATQLEKHGFSINDPLWSAVCLIKDAALIKLVWTLDLYRSASFNDTPNSFACSFHPLSWRLSLKFFLLFDLCRFIGSIWRPVQTCWSLLPIRSEASFSCSCCLNFHGRKKESFLPAERENRILGADLGGTCCCLVSCHVETDMWRRFLFAPWVVLFKAVWCGRVATVGEIKYDLGWLNQMKAS